MTKKQKPDAKSPSKLPAFAKKLKDARLQRNWSLRDVEKRTGDALSRQTVLRAEQGDVQLDTLFKLVNLYDFKKDEKDALIEDFNAHELKKAKAAA